MKHFLSTILLFVCTQIHGSELSLIDASLFQYATSNTEIPDQIMRELTSKTITLCEHSISQQHCAEIFTRLSPELGLLTDASPILVAQALAELILKNPTPIEILFTLTQLTIASEQVPQHEHIDTKANFVVHAVRAGLEPLIKIPGFNVPTAWIYIGVGVTISALVIIGVWYFVIKQRQATATLTHNQAALLTHIENLEARMEETIRKTNACKNELEVLDDEIEDMAADMVKLDKKIVSVAESTATVATRATTGIRRAQALAERAHAFGTMNQRTLIAALHQDQELFEHAQDTFAEMYAKKPKGPALTQFDQAMEDAIDIEAAVAIGMKQLNKDFPTPGTAETKSPAKHR